MHQLNRDFFHRPTVQVAQDLLGKILVIGDCSGRINEVEAYVGEDDPACHAVSGKTARNAVMYGPPGHLYVYFTYGMYHCANIVTENEDFPSAVLIRGVEPLTGIELMEKRRGRKPLADGPGKLCIAFDMTKQTHNGLNLCGEDPHGVFDDGFVPQKIQSTSRIGIKVGLDKQWRFLYQ